MTHRVVFLDRDTIAPYINVRKPSFEHEWTVYDRTTKEQAVERLAGADIAIINKVKLPAESLAKLPDLKLIAIAATGTDNVDLEYCRNNNIIVSNIRGYAVRTVPEHAFALILALRRSIIGFRQDVKDGEWQKADQFCFFNHPIEDLNGARIGIFGEGILGQGVASIARGFGMEPVFAAHKGVEGLGPLYMPFDEVIETSDVISLHCPLMPSTKDMIGLDELKRMKDSVIIVNTSRGGLINEEALVTAINEGMIGGAGIDVMMPEPPAADHPFFELLNKPNFILTPHIAWASRQAQHTLSEQLIDNVENFVAGNPSNIVGAF